VREARDHIANFPHPPAGTFSRKREKESTLEHLL